MCVGVLLSLLLSHNVSLVRTTRSSCMFAWLLNVCVFFLYIWCVCFSVFGCLEGVVNDLCTGLCVVVCLALSASL